MRWNYSSAPTNSRLNIRGFKDVGLQPGHMQKVVTAMKDAGKTTFLEVVSLSEEEGLRGARLAVELGFDILMGTVFFPSIAKYSNRQTSSLLPISRTCP